MTVQRVSDLLPATAPFPQYAAKLMLFGQFVGSWDIEGTWHQADGTTRTGKGEWHFDWILGGRGIQDVLFSKGASPDQFGTTLRCYDKDLDAWHLTWMQPASGEFVNLLGRQLGDRIVCETVDSKPRRRWSFADITPSSFHWLGEVSSDDGNSWFLEQEMRASRR
ncbi:MAG TPA: hypothetical protein VFL17_01570 [Anaerolineae bacterium]|nr:hypothetical protein [Anaerolineae bacterium]